MLPNIGWGELILIFLIVLLLFGAKRLPEIGRSIGKGIQAFKKGMNGVDEDEQKDKDNVKDKNKEE